MTEIAGFRLFKEKKIRYDGAIQKARGRNKRRKSHGKDKKPTQSEIDGVQYRKAKLWQIILYASNALCGLTI